MSYICSDVRHRGRFTLSQAQQDFTLDLWQSLALIYLDEYFEYYLAAHCLQFTEKKAADCGTWYYRYSVALMFSGQLEEALKYAIKGSQEESDYPWVWLQVGKLQSHFGNKEAAFKAVDRGLALVPGDYEFEALKKEIESEASL